MRPPSFLQRTLLLTAALLRRSQRRGTQRSRGRAFVALPAGILGAGFVEEFQKLREKKQQRMEYPPHSMSVADEIRKFALLRDDGIISNDQFEEQKSWLLKR